MTILMAHANLEHLSKQPRSEEIGKSGHRIMPDDSVFFSVVYR